MTGSIDKQEAIKLVADYLYNLMSPRCIGLTPDHCWKEAEDILAEAPSAEPEIIRCKDCKWYGRVDKRRFYRGMDCLKKRIDTIIPDKDFCSKAERREE